VSDGEGIKVSAGTRALVRLGATLNHCTQSALVEVAVDEYLRAHRDELEAGLANAREVLIPSGPLS
jgi:hypothetical protein